MYFTKDCQPIQGKKKNESAILKHKLLQNEIETLTKELDNIENKHAWLTYELPNDTKSAQWVFDLLLSAFFSKKDFEAIEKGNIGTFRDIWVQRQGKDNNKRPNF